MKKIIITLLILFNIYEIYSLVNTEKEYNKILNNKKYEEIENNLAQTVMNYDNDINNKYGYTLETINNLYQEKENNINEILNNIEKNSEKINLLKNQTQILEKKYNNLISQNSTTYIIPNVIKINQYEIGYPTGCESAALTILLNYWGYNVSVKEVADLLKKGEAPHYENNVRYGGNPYIEFIGNPTDPYSYGVYDKPIEDVANIIKPGIINATGITLNEVLEIVKQNRPVIVWNTMNLALPYISDSWIYKKTNEKINWLSSLHAIVVIGYNDNNIITSDTLTGTIRYFNRQVFENRYNSFGKRALYY